jgi:hypothetical protein
MNITDQKKLIVFLFGSQSSITIPQLITALNQPPIEQVEYQSMGKLVRITKLYGMGVQGAVVKAHFSNGNTYALKLGISADATEFQRDVQLPLAIFKKMARLHLAPELYGVYEFQFDKVRLRALVMDPIHTTLESLIYSKTPNDSIVGALDCLIRKKHVAQLLHGDMHTDNIVVLKDQNTMGFIDFDLSSLTRDSRWLFLDAIPLLQTMKHGPIRDQILQIYKKVYNVRLDTTKIISYKTGGFGYVVGKQVFDSYKVLHSRNVLQHFQTSFPTFVEPRLVK